MTMNATHELPSIPPAPAFPSRLSNVGTTIFTVISALAAQKGAVNLGQGFPDFDCDARIVDAVADAMRNGHNQYPPMAGAAPLRQAIARKIEVLYGRAYDADREITVTATTQALLTAVLCCGHPGDEIIVIEPMYDSYVPSIELAGGKPVFVSLEAAGLRAALRQDRRGDHAEDTPSDDQHAAQPDRPRVARGRHEETRGDRARHERADHLR